MLFGSCWPETKSLHQPTNAVFAFARDIDGCTVHPAWGRHMVVQGGCSVAAKAKAVMEASVDLPATPTSSFPTRNLSWNSEALAHLSRLRAGACPLLCSLHGIVYPGGSKSATRCSGLKDSLSRSRKLCISTCKSRALLHLVQVYESADMSYSATSSWSPPALPTTV